MVETLDFIAAGTQRMKLHDTLFPCHIFLQACASLLGHGMYLLLLRIFRSEARVSTARGQILSLVRQKIMSNEGQRAGA